MDYLRVGKATDLKDEKERKVYRFFEIVQGALSWGTIFLAFIFSLVVPTVVLYFLLVFVIFWLVISIYYSIHLYLGFKKMRENMEADWIDKLEGLEGYSLDVDDWREIYHVVILPNYKEPIGVIRDSLDALVSCSYPKNRMVVVLAFEKRAGEERKEVAAQLKREYEDRFFKLLTTFHPDDIVGEIKGKGANDAWASKKVKEKIIDPLGISYERVICSSFDVDTQVYPQYFSCVTYHYLTNPKPTRTSYQPVPLYNNNIWEAPFFSQTTAFTDIFWHIICQERPTQLITFSSHSMSFKALNDVGFRQTNMVNEDSRIFWQCFFYYDGDYQTQPIYYPVSLDANVGKNLWQTIKQVYKQQRRWGYPENSAYFLYASLKNKKVPLAKKIARGVELIGGNWNWAVASILIFTLGWMPIIFGQGWFSQSLASYTVPRLVSKIMTFAMLGLVTSVWISTVLLPPRPGGKGLRRYLFFLLGWLFVPIQLLIFGSLPVIDAQTRYLLGRYMGFWVTPKNRS